MHLRPTIEPAKYGLKLKVVLKWRFNYIESTGLGSLLDGLKMEGFVKWQGLKLQRPLYTAKLGNS